MNSRSSKMKSLNFNRHEKDDRQSSSRLTSTPVAQRIAMLDDDLSPIQIRCTQDGGDDELDVVWDWNSPQSRVKKSFKQRKRNMNKSPQIPRKIPPKNNLIPKFTSLRAELEKLNKSEEFIDLNDNKSEEFVGIKCMGDMKKTDDINKFSVGMNKYTGSTNKFGATFKLKEVTNKLTDGSNKHTEETIKKIPNKYQNVSNKCIDSSNKFNVDQSKLKENQNKSVNSNKFTVVTSSMEDFPDIDCIDLFGDDSFDDDLVRCSQQIEEAFTKPQAPQPKTLELLINKSANIADDSFDAILEDYTEDDIIKFSQTSPEKCTTPVKNSRTIYRTNSTPVRYQKPPERSDNILPRTKSAEVCGSPKSLITFSPEEIEKKRLEAKARLELKKAQKEMEKRRLEALERLNKKRLQQRIKK